MKKLNIATEEMRFMEYAKKMESSEKMYGREIPAITLEDMHDLMVSIDKESDALGVDWVDRFYEVTPPALDEFSMFAYAPEENSSHNKDANFEVCTYWDEHYNIELYYIQEISFTVKAEKMYAEGNYACSSFGCIRKAILMSGLENRYAILYSLIHAIGHLPMTYEMDKDHDGIIKRLTERCSWEW